jgi:ligand-binding sensor domain-containing protein/AraC-like DNA-binding protein
VWFGTQVGLDRFDGISILNIPFLKDYTVYDICESDSANLWIGTNKGLVRFDRRTEMAVNVTLDDRLTLVRTLYPVSDSQLLVGTTQGLFIYTNGTVEKIMFDANAFSHTNNIMKIIVDEEDGAFWIASVNGLIHFDLRTRESQVYHHPDPAKNSFSCILLVGDRLYAGLNQGIQVFNKSSRTFETFPYEGNPNIMTLSRIDEGELFVGTNGGGLLTVSEATGKVVNTISHRSDKGKINSDAIYSFLKDGSTYWISTFMWGVNYNTSSTGRFSIYSFGDLFDSRDYNVRSLWIGEDGRKVIGTRNDGFIYISENENIVRHFTSDNSILGADIVLSIYPLNEQKLLVGTYGGGLYQLDTRSLSLSLFRREQFFSKGSYPAFVRDKDGNLWIASSEGVYVYNTEDDRYILYNTTNSGLASNLVYSMKADSHDRIWIGTNTSVCYYDPLTKQFRSDIFPDNIRAFTRSVRFIYEDKQKNLWFCDNMEGVVKVDTHFSTFEHYTDKDFLPCNTITSIIEDSDGRMWFASHKGLVCRWGEQSRLFALYDGLPEYSFNTQVQQTRDGVLWWSNEHGLVYYDSRQDKTQSPVKRALPAITSISVAGKTLKAGDKNMPCAPVFAKKISVASGNNIEFAFSALNYSSLQTSIYDYCLEGYDNGWQSLIAKNRVHYSGLPVGKYIFKVRFSSDLEQETSLQVNVYREFPLMILGILLSLMACIVILFFYSRIQSRYKTMQRSLSAEYVDRNKYSKSRMDEREVRAVRNKLTEYMKNEKPYLNPDLKLQDIAQAIGCSSAYISQMLNIYLKTNFTDFVNQYRIEEFIVRVRDESAARYTLTSLSEQCGFSSRTSFFRIFKKLKGKTPAEYVKKN